METEFSNLNISDKDTDTVNTKNCIYCNKPFIEELWCKKCINSLEKLAENGDKEAMFNLAICYENGKGTEKNLEKAFYWYQKVAENGDKEVIFNLAKCYYIGEGTEKNLEKAFYWCQKAAENGVKEAMFNLTLYYRNGEGTEKNLKKAFYWCQKAAENGVNEAMLDLTVYYRNGKETETNLKKAFYWYQKAAENGNGGAMFNLAVCYRNGEGTEKNLEKAFYWYQKAAENGYKKAMFNLALCYNNEEGIEKNLEKAFHWFQKSAENGDEKAMYNLAKFYHDGIGTEKNLEKSFYLYQKAVENGDERAMFNLGSYYYNGKGTEKNLDKAFYWYQKAAENGDKKAMSNLAIGYFSGIGIEKNLEKAFHWFQKSAEYGDESALFALALCYNNGKGTEKSLEKAFYWYQKAAENGHEKAMFNLATCYNNGEGIEKNLEKAFYWYQKAAEKDHIEAMLSLTHSYFIGEGTEKNLEKAFYWHQKVMESDKTGPKNEIDLCIECKHPYIDYHWCQQCNTRRFQQDFSKWTSKNEFIDKFIQEAQLNAKNSYEVLEWIPYNKLSNINYYDKGGFSEIHKAVWSDGPIFSWSFDKQQWIRYYFQTGYEVILKTLNNSSSLNNKFLDEWKYHYNCQKKSFSKFIQFFGFTQDPNNLNYIIVLSYAKKGSLRKCLSDIIKFEWQVKLQLLKKIILGLKVIHESNLTHGDFHDGNILMSENYDELFVIDLGLCKPISDSQDNDNEIYGVLPYMAPEILRNNPYTPASDIYSFSMIMWEFTSGIPPFNHEAHDYDLILSICEGERPEIIKNTPKCYIDLMKKCWYYKLNGDGNNKYGVPNIDIKLKNEMMEFVEANKTLVQEQANTFIIQSHPQSCYTSRKLTEIFVQEESQGFDCAIKD
ncbi:HCP-like protein [Rhizophagus irregularis]|nr:HCP-like protein [Rhizophagus irregularis]